MPTYRCPRCQATFVAAEGAPLLCPHCGYPGPDARALVPQAPMVAGPAPLPPTSGHAVASLVVSIVGLFPYFGWILGPIAIVLSVKARRRIRESGGVIRGDGMAIAGLVMGIIGTVIGAIVFVMFILAAIILVVVAGAR